MDKKTGQLQRAHGHNIIHNINIITVAAYNTMINERKVNANVTKPKFTTTTKTINLNNLCPQQESNFVN